MENFRETREFTCICLRNQPQKGYLRLQCVLCDLMSVKMLSMFKLRRLGNGVRVVIVPMEGVESVSVGVLVACGSRYEEERLSGVSHFLEHMVFKGTKSFPTYDDVHVIERLGGIQNAYTDIDVTKYYAKVLATDWKKTLQVVSELAIVPKLPQREFDPERKVILEEMAMHEDDLPDKTAELFHGLVYRGSDLGRRIIGTAQSLSSIGRDEMMSFHEEKYKPENIVVLVSGKIHKETDIYSEVEKLFGGLKRGNNGGFNKLDKSKGGIRIKLLAKPDAEQINLALGFPVCDRFSDEKFALSVFNLLMGVGFSSRLFKKIREEMGLCYGIGSSVATYDEIGDWGIQAGLNSDKIDQAITAILNQTNLVLEKGVKEEEVEVAKKRFAAAAAFQMESPDRLGEFYGRQVIYGQKILTVDQYLEKIRSVTKEEVDKVAKKYLARENLNLVLVGKLGEINEEKVMKMLG